MSIAIGTGIGLKKHRSESGTPFKSDLALYYKGLTGDTLIEEKQGLNAKVICPSLLFITNNYYRDTDSTAYLVGGQPVDISFNFVIRTGSIGVRSLISYGAGTTALKGLYIGYNGTELRVYTNNGIGSSIIATFGSIVYGETNSCRFQWNGQTGGIMTMTINGIDYTSTTNVAWSGNSHHSLCVGATITTGVLGIVNNVCIFDVTINNTNTYHFTGLGKYVYDVTGSGKKLLKYGSAQNHNIVYYREMTTFPIIHGFSILRKQGQLSEYVPNGVNYDFLISDGYSLSSRDIYSASVDSLANYPCKIDFNPNDLEEDPRLDNVYRSKTDNIFNIEWSFTSNFDSEHPYWWDMLDLINYEAYTSFYKSETKGIFFTKIDKESELGGVRLSEILIYKSPKVDNDLSKVKTFCNIEDRSSCFITLWSYRRTQLEYFPSYPYETGFDYYIDWGDGSEAEHRINGDTPSHDVLAGKYYHISVSGNFVRMTAGEVGYDRQFQYIKGVVNWGNVNFTQIAFSYCSSFELLVDAPITGFNPAFFNSGIANMFGATSIKSIPVNLFDNCNLLTNLYLVFAECVSLTSIPAGLFDKLVNLTSCNSTFSGCTSLSSIPSGLFDNCTELLQLQGTFYNCPINELPISLFDNCTKLTHLDGCFQGAALESIRADLFSNCPNIVNISSCFLSTAITSIPGGLFDACTELVYADYCFGNCTQLTSIPSELFDNCTELISIAGIFAQCHSLLAIPGDLFDNSLKIFNFNSAFQDCTSLTGLAPEYWLRINPTPEGGFCFYNCLGLSNYADIPSNWRE